MSARKYKPGKYTGKVIVFAKDPIQNRTYEKTKEVGRYQYRGLPCTQVRNGNYFPMEYCVTGEDSEGGCGVLEWCYNKEDAENMVIVMKRYPEFKNLSAQAWEGEGKKITRKIVNEKINAFFHDCE